MHLAPRIHRIKSSATADVWRRAAELREAGVSVVDFGAGEPDFPSPSVAVEAAQSALGEGFTKYTAVTGIPDLRRALARSYQDRYGSAWDPASQVLVTVGAKAALFELALALFDRGDEVIIPSPCWVSFPEQVRIAGAQPILVPMSSQDGFRIHTEPILEAMTAATRAVVLNSPANPTGGILEGSDLRRLVEHCAENHVVLVSDETYERFLYDGRAHSSAASLAAEFPETVVVVGSFSKTYAMTGWRIGYAMGAAEVITAAQKVQSHATSNPTSFAMVGALRALEGAEAEVRAMVTEYESRRDLVVEGLNRLPGVSCLPPAGAFYAFPRVADCYAQGRRGSVDFAQFLLDEARVAVVPGAAFGNDDHLRISFACSRHDIQQGLDRMASVLS